MVEQLPRTHCCRKYCPCHLVPIGTMNELANNRKILISRRQWDIESKSQNLFSWYNLSYVNSKTQNQIAR